MKGKKVSVKRILIAVCTLLLLISAVYVPVSLTAFAESNIITCDFEKSLLTNDNDKNKEELNKNGIGIYGWSGDILKYEGDNTLCLIHNNASQNWCTIGGYRLNSDGKMLNLKPDTSYAVTFKLKVVCGPVSITGSNSSPATVSIGYGARFDAALPGNSTNYVNTLGNKISDVVSLGKDAESFTLYNNGVASMAEFSNQWNDVYYTFTTPAASALSGKDMALTVFSNRFYGMEVYIDDVRLVEIAKGDGAVLLVDEYGQKLDILIGKVGETATLDDISNRKNQNDHVFEGWHTDKALTEKAEEVLFNDKVSVLYSKWEAPVTYTFVDTLSDKEIKLNGKAGESITFPNDPTDAKDESWFMGWYHEAELKNEFTDTKFGYKSKTVYSKWLKEIPTLTQDFENYTKHEYKIVQEKGYNVKDNRLYFSMMMEKQSKETYGESGNAIKFAWDKNMVKDPNNPSSYDAASRYNQMDMYVWLGGGLDNNQEYVVTFKYKVEKADTDMNFYVASAMTHNIWANYFVAPNTAAVSKNDAGKGWKEATLTFTTKYKNDTSKDMFLGVKLVKNENVTLYFDDVSIKPKAQPYEAFVNVETNTKDGALTVTGRRGEEIVLPSVTHPEGAEFLG